jgi:quercetin dioxygenase-like cupin family protein
MIVDTRGLEFRELPGRLAADPFGSSPVEGVSVRVVRLDGDTPRSPHRHPRTYEVMYVVTGGGHLWRDGAFHRVEEGDLVAVPPGVPHATLPDPGTQMELVCFFPDADLSTNIEELQDPEDLRSLREAEDE